MQEQNPNHPRPLLGAEAFSGSGDPRRFIVNLIGILGFVAIVLASHSQHYSDFSVFFTAGNLVGSRVIEHLATVRAWQMNHHLLHGAFVYPFGFAWLYAGCKLLPIRLADVIMIAVNIVLAALLSQLLARRFQLQPALALLLTFAWTPVIITIIYGQTSILALLVVLAAWHALRHNNDFLAGVAIGFLFYKPTYALPFFAWSCVNQRWKISLGAVLWLPIWYLLGISATAGDIRWPLAWIQNLAGYHASDTHYNQAAFVGLPGILEHMGLPLFVVLPLVTTLFTILIVRTRAQPIEQTFMLTSALIPALTPHALGYDATLTLPALLTACLSTRTLPPRSFFLAYAIGLGWIFSNVIGFDMLSIPIFFTPFALMRPQGSLPASSVERAISKGGLHAEHL